jgi:hypothetical protein
MAITHAALLMCTLLSSVARCCVTRVLLRIIQTLLLRSPAVVKALNIPPRRKGRADGTDDPSTLPDLIKAFGAPNPFKVSQQYY